MSQTVKLNVGGTLFETTPSTLVQSKFFVALLNGKFTEDPTAVIFIDRSGMLFEHVLNFLRNPDYRYTGDNSSFIQELDYYGIDTSRVQKYVDKLNIMWNHLKKNKKMCPLNDCFTILPNKYKYCFKCVPPKLGIVILKGMREYLNNQITPVIFAQDEYKTINLIRGIYYARDKSGNYDIPIWQFESYQMVYQG